MGKERLALRWKANADRGMSYPTLETEATGVEIGSIRSLFLGVSSVDPFVIAHVGISLSAIEDFTATVLSSKKICGVCRQPLAHLPQDAWLGKQVDVKFPRAVKYGVPAGKVQLLDKDTGTPLKWTQEISITFQVPDGSPHVDFKEIVPIFRDGAMRGYERHPGCEMTPDGFIVSLDPASLNG